VPLQNNGEYKYNQEVTYTLSATNLNEYRSIAEQINERKDIGRFCIQHEFEFFGGEYSAFALAFNKTLPTIFHTVSLLLIKRKNIRIG
jgi:hypothetical protein